MRKLFALYTNEMIKISKKISVIIILAIMVVGVAGFGGLMKLQDSMSSKSSNNSVNYNLKFQKENMNNELENNKDKIADIQKQKKSATGEALQNLEAEERNIQNQIDMIQYAKEKDIVLYTESYRSQAIQMLFNYEAEANQLKEIPEAVITDEQKKQLTKAQNSIPVLEKIIENKDFKGYISFSNDELNSNTAMSKDEKKIYMESNELRLKYNLTGEENSVNMYGSMNNYIYQIERAKLSLLKDIDYTGDSQNQKPLTQELRKKIKNDIAVIEYKIEKGIINSNGMGMDVKIIVMPGLLGIGIFMIALLTMILAGGSVSQEISSGSIKSLIISPTKRWKIFTAKVLSLLTIGIISALLLYIVAIATGMIFFGYSVNVPYIYAINGVAHQLNFYIYQLARLFSDYIGVIVFMAFAMMLSIVTRNTAASVGISIAVFFVGSNANTILMRFVSGEWTKFIPFNNLDFTTMFFPYDNLTQVTNGMNNTANNSLAFSICYVAFLLLCMGYTALDSFNRRDIK